MIPDEEIDAILKPEQDEYDKITSIFRTPDVLYCIEQDLCHQIGMADIYKVRTDEAISKIYTKLSRFADLIHMKPSHRGLVFTDELTPEFKAFFNEEMVHLYKHIESIKMAIKDLNRWDSEFPAIIARTIDHFTESDYDTEYGDKLHEEWKKLDICREGNGPRFRDDDDDL